MLKRPISYTDFDDVERTEFFYFNISEMEFIELEVRYPEGIVTFLKNIQEAQDNKKMFDQFTEFILMSYGEKSDDGKHFVKSEELSKRFSQSAAYPALFMEFLQDPNKLPEFFIGIMPKKFQEEMAKNIAEETKDVSEFKLPEPATPPLGAMPAPPRPV